MKLLRAIAQHYASLPGMIVPADRFTQGYRGQLDHIPAITYELTGAPEEPHQLGSGLVVASINMTVWAETPGQAGRIADQLRDHFHLLQHTTIGTDPDDVFVIYGRLDTRTDSTEYPQDDGAAHVAAATLYFDFTFAGESPATVP